MSERAREHGAPPPRPRLQNKIPSRPTRMRTEPLGSGDVAASAGAHCRGAARGVPVLGALRHGLTPALCSPEKEAACAPPAPLWEVFAIHTLVPTGGRARGRRSEERRVRHVRAPQHPPRPSPHSFPCPPLSAPPAPGPVRPPLGPELRSPPPLAGSAHAMSLPTLGAVTSRLLTVSPGTQHAPALRPSSWGHPVPEPPDVARFSPLPSSGSFNVLHRTFKTVTPFELLSVTGVRPVCVFCTWLSSRSVSFVEGMGFPLSRDGLGAFVLSGLPGPLR